MTDDSQISALERLTKLRDGGALTQEEFEREKAKVMAEPPVTAPFYRKLWVLVTLTCLILTFPIALLILVTGNVYRCKGALPVPIGNTARYVYASALGLCLAAVVISVASSPKYISQRGAESAPDNSGSPSSPTASKNNDLACDSSDAIGTVTSIAQKNQPTDFGPILLSTQSLLRAAMSDVLGKQREDLITGITQKLADARLQCASQGSPDIIPGGGMRNTCMAQIDDQVYNDANDETQKLYIAALGSAVYSLNTIRMEARDSTTGATTCAAKLHVEVPKYGAAEEDIQYKLERTSDGKLFATVQGLQ